MAPTSQKPRKLGEGPPLTRRGGTQSTPSPPSVASRVKRSSNSAIHIDFHSLEKSVSNISHNQPFSSPWPALMQGRVAPPPPFHLPWAGVRGSGGWGQWKSELHGPGWSPRPEFVIPGRISEVRTPAQIGDRSLGSEIGVANSRLGGRSEFEIGDRSCKLPPGREIGVRDRRSEFGTPARSEIGV